LSAAPYDFPLAIGGHKAKQASPADLRNIYPSRSEANGRVIWNSFPGLKLRTTGSGVDRGDHTTSAGVRYVLNGITLYKEGATGTRTSMGTILGNDRAIFADDGSTVGIVANNTLYRCNGTAVFTVTQSVITNPSAIDFINNQWILSGDNQQFAVSDVGDITTWDALNFATEDSRGDALLRPYVFNQLVYMIGTRSIVPWFNTGVGNPPFDRQDTGLINTGAAGKYAVTNSDEYLYLLSDDRKFYRVIGGSRQEIQTTGIAHIVSKYDVIDDCVASSFVWDGQTFVLFRFPSEGDALLYSETANLWMTLSSGVDALARRSWFGSAVSFAHGKCLTTDYRNGNTYELDAETYTDNGETRLRLIVGNPITSDVFGVPGRSVTVGRLTLTMAVGVGLESGQGSNPVVMCEWSSDGGHNYHDKIPVSIGAMGGFTERVNFDQFITGRELVPRISISDPVSFTLYTGSSVEVFDGGY